MSAKQELLVNPIQSNDQPGPHGQMPAAPAEMQNDAVELNAEQSESSAVSAMAQSAE